MLLSTTSLKQIAICTGMAKTLGSVSLKLEDEVLVRGRSNTTVVDLLEQLDKACKGGRIQDAEGFDVTAHYSQDLPEGDYVIKQPVSGKWSCSCCSITLVHCPACRRSCAAASCF